MFLATRMFALLARHACSRIRCPLYDYAFVFRSTFFLFFSFYFHFLPSLFFMQISRAFVFLFLVPSPYPPRWKIKCEEGGGDFNRLKPRESEGAGGEGVNRFV